MFNPYNFFDQGSEVRVINRNSMHCNKIGIVDKTLSNAVIIKLGNAQYAFTIEELTFVDRSKQIAYDNAKQEELQRLLDEENKTKEKVQAQLNKLQEELRLKEKEQRLKEEKEKLRLSEEQKLKEEQQKSKPITPKF